MTNPSESPPPHSEAKPSAGKEAPDEQWKARALYTAMNVARAA
jgi:hypothetical protein